MSQQKQAHIAKWVSEVGAEEFARLRELGKQAGFVAALLPTPSEMNPNAESAEPAAAVEDEPRPAIKCGSTHKTCIDCGEYLQVTKAFMRDGRGSHRSECRACYNRRYRSGDAKRYRHRYSYKTREAK